MAFARKRKIRKDRKKAARVSPPQYYPGPISGVPQVPMVPTIPGPVAPPPPGPAQQPQAPAIQTSLGETVIGSPEWEAEVLEGTASRLRYGPGTGRADQRVPVEAEGELKPMDINDDYIITADEISASSGVQPDRKEAGARRAQAGDYGYQPEDLTEDPAITEWRRQQRTPWGSAEGRVSVSPGGGGGPPGTPPAVPTEDPAIDEWKRQQRAVFPPGASPEEKREISRIALAILNNDGNEAGLTDDQRRIWDSLENREKTRILAEVESHPTYRRQQSEKKKSARVKADTAKWLRDWEKFPMDPVAKERKRRADAMNGIDTRGEMKWDPKTKSVYYDKSGTDLVKQNVSGVSFYDTPEEAENRKRRKIEAHETRWGLPHLGMDRLPPISGRQVTHFPWQEPAPPEDPRHAAFRESEDAKPLSKRISDSEKLKPNYVKNLKESRDKKMKRLNEVRAIPTRGGPTQNEMAEMEELGREIEQIDRRLAAAPTELPRLREEKKYREERLKERKKELQENAKSRRKAREDRKKAYRRRNLPT